MDSVKIRDLKAEEIDLRIGQIGDGYFTLLAYKDARVDMEILDGAFGADRWQREHYAVKDNLYCRVGVFFDECGWVWKSDCGTESNTEKEKGEASDSFKRACVNWGIGRELYTAPLIRIKCDCKKGDKQVDFSNFKIDSIEIRDKQIKQLTVSAWNKKTKQGEVIFSFGKPEGKGPAKAETKQPVKKAEKKPEKTQAQHIAELIDGSHLTGEDIAGKIKADYKKSKVNELTPEEFKAFYIETREAIKKFESEVG